MFDTSCSSDVAGGRKSQRVPARYDRNERRGDVADVDLWSQHRWSCFVLLFSFQVSCLTSSTHRLHLTTHTLQPKHGRLQLLQQRHHLVVAWNEQRCPVAAVLRFQQNHRFWVLVYFQFIWPLRSHANVFGEHCCQPGFSLRLRCSHSFLHTNVYPVRPTSGEVRRAGVARFQHTAPPARSMLPHATCSTRRIVFSAVCFPSCVAVSRLKSLLN